MLNCYLERSPSGTGVKAIGRSALVGGEIKFHHDPLAFTTWKGARYVALTGHPMSHPYGDDPTMGITSLLEEWFPAKSGASVPTSLADRPSFIREGDTRGTDAITDADIYPPLSDDDVVARILASPQAAKFLKLCRGEISDYGDDRSKADQALVNILAYWCRRDVEQIDRLFRQSKLYRSKWEVRSYRLATINKAVRSWA
jgi:putative DNA primase/helicase